MKKRNNHTGLKAGAGIAAMALGAYYLYGKASPKQKRAVKSWALKARAEVMDAVERLPNLDRSTYNRVVKTVASKYAKAQKLGSAEARKLERELRAGWAPVASAVKAHAKRAVRTLKRAMK